MQNTLTEEEAARVRELVSQVGERNALRKLEVSRPTLVRAVARFGITRGSALLIRTNLAAAAGGDAR